MLKSKVNFEGSLLEIYDSSNIIASNYNETNKEMSIFFNSGVKYVYPLEERSLYFQFKTVTSQGKFFNKNFKGLKFNSKEEYNLSDLKKLIS